MTHRANLDQRRKAGSLVSVKMVALGARHQFDKYRFQFPQHPCCLHLAHWQQTLARGD